MQERRCKALLDWELAGRPSDRLLDVSAFLKRELVEPGKHCHIIGSRNDVMQCILGPYFAALGDVLSEIPGARCIKANSIGKAEYLSEALYGCINVLEDDYSAWDSTITQFDLGIADRLYHSVFGDLPREVITALCAHRSSAWKYGCGIRYTLDGSRVSGDSDTTVGNTIIHWCYNHALLVRQNHYPLYDAHNHFEVSGDDGVLGLSRPAIDLEVLQKCGKEVKAIYRVDPACTTFCSGITFPVMLDGVRTTRYYRLPGRVINRLCFTSQVLSARQAPAQLAYKALSELYACAGCPVLHALAGRVYRDAVISSTTRPIFDREVQRRLDLERTVPPIHTVDAATRLAFAEVFGVGPAEQIEAENYLRSFRPGDAIVHPVLARLARASA